MQFGRVHGIALIVFGLILICLQFDISLTGKTQVSANTSGQRTTAQTPTHMHGFGPLPGIIGGVSLIAGFAVFRTARRRDEPDPQHAVR
jgi:hypothetical protein